MARSRQAEGLTDGSSRPHRQPRRLAAPLEAAILRLRRTRATAWQISTALGLPRSTVTRVLARAGLNRVALLEPPAPVQRYEWAEVGDLLHVDLKRLGRVVGIGHRIHGDRRRRARRVGWEYLHVAIDDATRLTYAEVLPADDAPACAAFLQRTLVWFRRRGIRMRRLLTDNAMVVSRWHLRRRLPALDGAAPVHPALSAPDQWQGRARYSNAAPRVGVSRALSQLGETDGRAPPVSPLLQPPASPCELRPALAVDAFPRGCLTMNNLFDIHS